MAPMTARAKKSLSKPQPWDRTKWPSSTPPGWQLSPDGKNWQLPPADWRYNGVYWFLVRDCEAFAKGSCTKGDKCKKFHRTTARPTQFATGSLSNSSTETLIIDNVNHPEIKTESTIVIKILSRAESTKDESEDMAEAEKGNLPEEATIQEPNADTHQQQQQTTPIDDTAPHEALLAELRTVDGFQVLADYTFRLQTADSTPDVADKHSNFMNLILVARPSFDYRKGVQIYYQWLLEKQHLPKESTFHDVSGADDCCLYSIQELINQENTCHHGLVLITQPKDLCPAGCNALLHLFEAHPGLAVVLANQAEGGYAPPQTVAAKFPTTLELYTNRKYEHLRRIRELSIEALEAKYRGKMHFDGGSDGSLIMRYARSIHRSCRRNYEEDSLQEKIKDSLSEACKRHVQKLLDWSDDGNKDNELFVLSPNDVFPNETPEDNLGKKPDSLIDAEKLKKQQEEQEKEEKKKEEQCRKQFEALQEHIDTKLPQLAALAKQEHGSLLVGWRQLNLNLAGGSDGDYLHGIKPYYRALRATGLVSSESKYLLAQATKDCGCDPSEEDKEDEEEDDGQTSDENEDESDDEADDLDHSTDDDSSRKMEQPNCITKIVGDIKEGLLVIDTAEYLCKAGMATLQALQKERPSLFVVLDLRTSKASDEVKQFSQDFCPFVVDIDEDNAKLKSTTYLESQVTKVFLELVEKKYEGHMKFEGGAQGLLVQACIRRIVKELQKDADEQGIEKEVQSYLIGVHDRHLERHMACSEKGAGADSMLLTCSDLLGKEPDVTRYETDEWKELNKMVGMESVKLSIQALFDGLLVNYYREIHSKEPLQVGLSKVFLGPAGTGKTTVAKLYGKLLETFGVLSNGDLLVKNASDFIGRYIGYSAHQTKEILKEAKGKVLLIDEAYMLDSKRNSDCPFRQEAVDTLVGEVQNKPGDDICIILCGYKTEMDNFIRDANPGFQRRFPLADAFIFNDFTEEQLSAILDLKMETQSLSTTSEGRAIAMDVIKLAKQRPNFGNGGEIDNLLSRAMLNFQRRFGSAVAPQDRLEAARNCVLLPQDFDLKYNRVQTAHKNVGTEIDMIGMDAQKAVFAQLSTQAKAMKKFGRDPKPYMPFTLVFKGPPGTGKTSFARHIGRIYYEMGILATADVVEASITDMIAGYVGQTALKTRTLLERGLGKVLLIDEAYRLSGRGEGRNCFSGEARDELVDCLTKPEFARKLVIVLAGYAGETENMLSQNPGLSSRFPMHIDFEPLPSSLCVGLLRKRIEEADVVADFDVADEQITACLDRLRQEKEWSNGRDIETMAAEMVRKSFEASAKVVEVDDGMELSSPAVTKTLALEVMKKRLPKTSVMKKPATFDIRNFQVPANTKPIMER